MEIAALKSDQKDVKDFLFKIIKASSAAASVDWLKKQLEVLRQNFSEKNFYLTFSLLPRHFSKEKIKFTQENLTEARSNFFFEDLTSLQAARIFIALQVSADDEKRFLKIFNTLFTTGEFSELAALYSALPLLPHPQLLKSRAAEGIRTSMTAVFDAVALNNSYPADFLDDEAWNQMVLKAIFLERPLNKIIGIDKRANKDLVRMLSDYAHERWAASRYVSPELWRPFSKFIDEEFLKDIRRLFEKGNDLEKQAAALAVYKCDFAPAKNLLSKFPELRAKIDSGNLYWDIISVKWHAEKINV